jgi:Flp pilus assembly secretin CpaC
MASFMSSQFRKAGVLGALSVVLLSSAAAAENAVDVSVDRASILRAPDGTSTVIIGNPLIADATMQKNGVLVITGKSYGSTNIMLLDGAGAVLSETLVSVRRAQDNVVVVQRGAKRESFACMPRCEPVLAVGDSPDSFSATAGQINQRGGMSTGREN